MNARAVTVALACLSLGMHAPPELDLPSELVGYRSWSTLTPEAKLVSPQLAALCISMSKERAEQLQKGAKRAYGLHAERFVKVFANPVAMAVFQRNVPVFPAGAIIAKEKLLQPQDKRAEGLAFMIKHEPGEFPSSDGWEFRYYPSAVGASYASCIECHRTGNSRDHVFTRLNN